jgi:hypothetical protein
VQPLSAFKKTDRASRTRGTILTLAPEHPCAAQRNAPFPLQWACQWSALSLVAPAPVSLLPRCGTEQPQPRQRRKDARRRWEASQSSCWDVQAAAWMARPDWMPVYPRAATWAA